MSQENVEAVRRHQDAWNLRDLTGWLDSFRSDAEIDWSRSRGPLKGVYRGLGELKVFWDEFWSTFEDVRVELHGIADGGSEVVISNAAHLRGRDGIEVICEEYVRVDARERADHSLSDVPGTCRSPRSRRSAGVGVAS